MSPLVARYASKCFVCRRPVKPGELMTYDTGRAWHASCPGPIVVNRREAPCVACGATVAPGAGSLTSVGPPGAEKWLVRHLDPDACAGSV